MKKPSDLIREALARITGNAASKDKPLQQALCKFCGQTGHEAADCPNAAKFHAFSVDHDAEDDGEAR